MKDDRDKLIKLLARTEVLRKSGLDVKKKIDKTKNNWHNLVQNQIEILRRKAERGSKKDEIAYMNLLRQRKLLT